MMWAKTARIGCGLTAYRSGRFNARLYVCNYGESGNVISLPVYRIGGACEDCRGSCSRDYPALCSAPGAPAAGHNVGSADPSLSAAHSNSNNTPVNFGQPQQPSLPPAVTSSTTEECKSLVCMINKPVKMMGEGGMQLAHQVGDAAMNTVDFVARPVNTFVTGGLDLVGRPFGFGGFRPFRFPSEFRFTSPSSG